MHKLQIILFLYVHAFHHENETAIEVLQNTIKESFRNKKNLIRYTILLTGLVMLRFSQVGALIYSSVSTVYTCTVYAGVGPAIIDGFVTINPILLVQVIDLP